MKKAIDVSAWQGLINWQNVRMDCIETAILRAGYGQNGVDKQFHRNAEECKRYGVEGHVYWFMYSLDKSMAAQEGAYAVAAAKQHFSKCCVFTDLEYDSIDYARKKGVTIGRAQATANVVAFCKKVAQLGFIPGIYTNIDYLKRYFDMNAIRAAVPGIKLWIASWSNAKQPPSGYGAVDVWQYSSKGRVNGISGNVDMDYVYSDLGAVTGAVAGILTETPKNAEATAAVPVSGGYTAGGVDYSPVFDPSYYESKNPDVAGVVNGYLAQNPGASKAAKLFEHFYYCGMTEHRQGCAAFDPAVYRSKYSDLDRAFGNEWRKYYDHYCIYGKKEIESGKRGA